MISRRQVMTAVAGAIASIAGIGCVSAVAVSRRRYGLVTVDSWVKHRHSTGESLRVYLNGVEMTKVYEADDISGYVSCYCRDTVGHSDVTQRGHVHMRDGKACSWRLYGDVVITPENRV